MNADKDGKIIYKKFKNYFTAVPEDDLKDRVSSNGARSMNSMQKFENQLDAMLLGGSALNDWWLKLMYGHSEGFLFSYLIWVTNKSSRH